MESRDTGPGGVTVFVVVRACVRGEKGHPRRK